MSGFKVLRVQIQGIMGDWVTISRGRMTLRRGYIAVVRWTLFEDVRTRGGDGTEVYEVGG